MISEILPIFFCDKNKRTVPSIRKIKEQLRGNERLKEEFLKEEHISNIFSHYPAMQAWNLFLTSSIFSQEQAKKALTTLLPIIPTREVEKQENIAYQLFYTLECCSTELPINVVKQEIIAVFNTCRPAVRKKIQKRMENNPIEKVKISWEKEMIYDIKPGL